jgi:hypothetical protein
MLDLSSRKGFDSPMRILLAAAIATIAMTIGCVRAPAQPLDPSCNCTLRQQNPNGAYYPYSGR